MRIRTQLLLAFLLLAVLPLVGIVGFSFFDSQHAIQRVATAEAEQLSEEMESRMVSAREKLRSRVGKLPWTQVLKDMEDGEADDRQQVRELLAGELGEMAPALESLAFEPAAPVAPAPPRPPVSGAAPSVVPEPPEPGVVPIFDDIETIVVNVDLVEDMAVSALRETTRIFHLEMEEDGDEGNREEIVRIEDLVDLENLANLSELRILHELEGVRVFDAAEQEKLEQLLAAAAEQEAEAQAPPSVVEGEMEGDQPTFEDSAKFQLWREAKRLEAKKARQRALQEVAKLQAMEQEKKARLVFGDPMGFEVREGDRVLGALRPKLNPERMLSRIFSLARRGDDEIPFAVDAEGNLYTASDDSRGMLQSLGAIEAPAGTSWRRGEWVVAISADDSTGLKFGVARPMGDAMRELRGAALRNLVVGLFLISLAVLGILPVSQRISSGVREVAEGAERLARGDLETRLPVRGRGELAHLSRSFNSMVHDLRDHQERLLAGERQRRDEEVERQLMQAELHRQGQELEDAREFQLSMLPRRVPRHDSFELAAYVETATEVGGDYHDFHLADDDRLTAAIGDATGHGARAGTMVTVIKSLFSAYSGVKGPASFLTAANKTIRRMELGRMTMALTVLSIKDRRVTLACAGMPPLLHHRAATGEVDEVMLPGMPLGGLAIDYREQTFEVEVGDTLLLYSDGLPEQRREGEPVGYEFVSELFSRLVSHSVEKITSGLSEAFGELTAGLAPDDDMTILVLRIR